MTRYTDNRDMTAVTDYQEARIEALTRRVKELESALRFVLALEDSVSLNNISKFIDRRSA